VTQTKVTGLIPTQDKLISNSNMYIAHDYSILSNFTT